MLSGWCAVYSLVKGIPGGMLIYIIKKLRQSGPVQSGLGNSSVETGAWTTTALSSLARPPRRDFPLSQLGLDLFMHEQHKRETFIYALT